MQALTEVSQELERRFAAVQATKDEIERLLLRVADEERKGVEFACGRLGEADGRSVYEMAKRHYKASAGSSTEGADVAGGPPPGAAQSDADGPMAPPSKATSDAGARTPTMVPETPAAASGAAGRGARQGTASGREGAGSRDGGDATATPDDVTAAAPVAPPFAGGKGFRPPPWKRRERGRVEMLNVPVPDKHQAAADALVLEALEAARTGDPEQAKRYDRSFGRAVWKRMLFRAVFTEEFEGDVPVRAETARAADENGEDGTQDDGRADGPEGDSDRDDVVRADAGRGLADPPDAQVGTAAPDGRAEPEPDDGQSDRASGIGAFAIVQAMEGFDAPSRDAEPEEGPGEAVDQDAAANAVPPDRSREDRLASPSLVRPAPATHPPTPSPPLGASTTAATGTRATDPVGREPAPPHGVPGAARETTTARDVAEPTRDRAPEVAYERIRWKGNEGARVLAVPVAHPGDLPATADEYQSGRIVPRTPGSGVVFSAGYLEAFGADATTR